MKKFEEIAQQLSVVQRSLDKKRILFKGQKRLSTKDCIESLEWCIQEMEEISDTFDCLCNIMGVK